MKNFILSLGLLLSLYSSTYAETIRGLPDSARTENQKIHENGTYMTAQRLSDVCSTETLMQECTGYIEGAMDGWSNPYVGSPPASCIAPGNTVDDVKGMFFHLVSVWDKYGTTTPLSEVSANSVIVMSVKWHLKCL
jgi:hypothetical protein